MFGHMFISYNSAIFNLQVLLCVTSAGFGNSYTIGMDLKIWCTGYLTQFHCMLLETVPFRKDSSNVAGGELNSVHNM